MRRPAAWSARWGRQSPRSRSEDAGQPTVGTQLFCRTASLLSSGVVSCLVPGDYEQDGIIIRRARRAGGGHGERRWGSSPGEGLVRARQRGARLRPHSYLFWRPRHGVDEDRARAARNLSGKLGRPRELLKERVPSLSFGATAGLSLGEFTALTAAAVLSFEDGLKVVRQRGRFMQEACGATRGGHGGYYWPE